MSHLATLDLPKILQDGAPEPIYYSPTEIRTFPYIDTIGITMTMKSEDMDKFKRSLLYNVDLSLALGLHDLLKKLKSFIFNLSCFSVDHLCVEWYNTKSHTGCTSITIIAHGAGRFMTSQGLVKATESQFFHEFLSAFHLAPLIDKRYFPICHRGEFQQLLESMCVHASLFKAGMSYKRPFYGWSH